MDISFLRALNTPCTCPTSVELLSRTVTSGEPELWTVIVSPVRDLIRPSSLTVSAATAGIRKTSPISDRVTTDTIERTLSCVIRLSPLCSCQAAITVDFCFIADNRFVVSYVKTGRLLISDDSGISDSNSDE